MGISRDFQRNALRRSLGIKDRMSGYRALGTAERSFEVLIVNSICDLRFPGSRAEMLRFWFKPDSMRSSHSNL